MLLSDMLFYLMAHRRSVRKSAPTVYGSLLDAPQREPRSLPRPSPTGPSDSSHVKSSDAQELRVATVTTDTEFAALKDSWNLLNRDRVPRSPFLSHDWCSAAFAWRCLDSDLHLQVARRAGRIVGILPLIRIRDGRRLRRLELITVPDTHLADLIAAPSDYRNVADALASALAMRSDWDTLQLGRLAPDGAAVTCFVPALVRHGFRVDTLNDGNNPFVALNGSWIDYYKSRSRRLKKAANNVANRIGKGGEVRVEWFRPSGYDEAQLGLAVETIIGISSRSWKGKTPYALDRPGPQSFIRRLSASACDHGWLSIWVLHVGDRPLAMEYQLIDDGYVHALRSDFDASCEELSPGSYLFRELLESLFGLGLRRYCMGPGDNPYKLRWTAEFEPLRRVIVYNRTLPGHIAWLRDAIAKPIARAVRHRLAGGRSLRMPEAFATGASRKEDLP